MNPSELLKTLLLMFTVRKLRRLVLAIVAFFLLALCLYWLLSPKGPPVTSAIGCKNKIAQILWPSEEDQVKNLAHLGNDATRIEEDYFNFISTMTQQCFHQIHLGPWGDDGGWEVCRYKEYDINPPCLVYSFGIGNDFRFEKHIEQKLGCEVHAFDPSMNLPSHQYSEKGHFHNVGIDQVDGYSVRGTWKMRRLQTIMKELGHTGRTIDYLKMDIEFSEWPALYDMIQTGLIKNIHQLGVELHTPEVDIHQYPDHLCTWSNHDTMATLLKIMIDLQNLGFGIYFTKTNFRTQFKSGLTGEHRYCCHNVYMLNTKFHPPG